jgi:hypothetical protein
MSLSIFLAYISSYSLIPAFIIGGSMYRKDVFSESLKIVYLCICFVLLMEIPEWVFYYQHKKNHFLVNIHIFFEFFILAYAYHHLAKVKIQKTIIALFMLVEACLLPTFNFSSWDNFNHFNSIANSVASLLMIAILFMYFYNLLQTLETKNILKEPWFWISAGALFYYSGVLFVFIFSDDILFSQSKSFTILWNIYYSFLFVFRIFLAIGLWLSKTQNSLNSSSKSVLQ